MKGKNVLTWLALVAAAFGGRASAAYSYRADFSVKDDADAAYGIDIERISHYSHAHGKVMDGRYAILLNGNRHFLSTPKLRDFRLEATWDVETVVTYGPGLGFLVRFRHDRDTGRGHEFQLFRDLKTKRLTLSLDGREIAGRDDDRTEFVRQPFVLEVAGNGGRVEVCGLSATFKLKDDGPLSGYVAFDVPADTLQQFYLRSVGLTSPDEVPRKEIGRYHFDFGMSQGFHWPVAYDVILSRFATGETLMEATISGTQRDRPKEGRLQTGGKEWCSSIERITSPYVRLLSAGRKERFYFWNGTVDLLDPLITERALKSGWTRESDPEWPRRFALTFRDFPADFSVAAGYEHAISSTWRFAEDGRREQVASADGRIVYDGEPLVGGTVCVKVSSPADKAIVGKIPRDIPKYAQARAFAERQHFFYESEPVRFTVDACFRDGEWSADEIALDFDFTDVYNDAILDGTCRVERVSETVMPGGIRRLRLSAAPTRTPSCGVYKLRWRMKAGVQPERTGEEIFEVLSDDPEGPCPPLASKLPTFVAMPNEIKSLEQNAFDPWGEFCGVGHYYSVDNRYPVVGNALEIWRTLPLYRRKWWCWNWFRNSDNLDMYSEYNLDLIRHSDYFGGFDNKRHATWMARYELGALDYYIDDQLVMLRDYVAERKPPLKLLTVEKLDMHVKENKPISLDELREIVDTCWRDYVDWCRPRITAHTQEFTDHVLAANPKSGLATYGPFGFYVSHYKTAYTLTYSGYEIEKDPRVRRNGSFWLFEEYHHSCDYPLFQAALFVASYDFHYGYGRRIFPEIYYAGWDRCLDGAVYMAHPLTKTTLANTHQRKIAYQYVYGTPQFRRGTYKFWSDYGFHARNPEKEAMDEFVHAWRNVVRNEPKRAHKAPFLMLDIDALKRCGEYLEDVCNPLIGGEPYGDVCNTGEEGLAYAYEQAVMNGYSTPVVSDFASLADIGPEVAEFVILPPIVEGTPPSVVNAIRQLHTRGVNLLASESVVGLEDVFGVEPDLAGSRAVGYLPGEPFSHRKAVARYRTTTARTVLAGAARAGAPFDIPMVVTNGTAYGRTAFVNVPPSVIRRESFRTVYHWGETSLCEALKPAYEKALAFVAPNPSVKSDHGLVSAAWTARDELVAVVSDESPIYRDYTDYPVPTRIRFAAPGIGRATIEADTSYVVVSRKEDEIVVRVSLDKDTAYFFKFAF